MNYKLLEETVFNLVGFVPQVSITYEEREGVFVCCDGASAIVGGQDGPAVARGLSELCFHLSKGQTQFTIQKQRSFKDCGVMLDVSREGVMRVEQIKKYLRMMAAMGLNVLMIYTEDIYEMEKYPYFGYQRGRYTRAELQEIDDYAFALGIEVVPCIQTLGHMERYLIWHEADAIRDTTNTLLPDSEATYGFIEDCIKTMYDTFRSRKIHIGMDEAVNIGLGAYAKIHSGQPIDQNEIFLKHLNRVTEICKRYDYEPMIWSDLFFTMANPNQRGNYDPTTVLSDDTIAKIPDVRLVYWYYSSKSEEKYLKLLQEHRRTGRKTAFAGSGWSFEGFAPNTAFAMEHNVPALKACVTDQTEVVLNTLWGDNGSECSYFLCMPTNALYAEFFYSGSDAAEEDAWAMFEFLTKQKRRTVELMDTLSLNQYGEVKTQRRLLRRDVFNVHEPALEPSINNFVMPTLTEMDLQNRYLSAAEELIQTADECGEWREYCLLIAEVLKVCAYKCEIYLDLRQAYVNNDRKKLAYLAKVRLPEMKSGYEKMYQMHLAQWRRENKAFGWSSSCSIYGRQLVRIDYAIDSILRFLEGELSAIEELEAEILNQDVPEYDMEFR